MALAYILFDFAWRILCFADYLIQSLFFFSDSLFLYLTYNFSYLLLT